MSDPHPLGQPNSDSLSDLEVSSGRSAFLPQGISFGTGPLGPPPKPKSDFGPGHSEAVLVLAALADDDPWREADAAALIRSESAWRQAWLSERITALRQAFAALIEAGEDPAHWRDPETLALRQQLLARLESLRDELQSEFLPLLPPERELLPLQRFVTAQLTKLDALRLGNASAWEKSREAAATARAGLAEAAVLPDELLSLLDLDRLLDTTVRYQFAWDVAQTASGEIEHHLTALQQIALTGLRAPHLPAAPAAEGHAWHWHEDQLRNDLGVSLRCLRGSYGDWMKRGLQCLQQAIRREFAEASPLLEALDCFYAAHSAWRERAEPLVAIAWLLTLLDEPVTAVDSLELALRRQTLPEIKELFWQIQALDPANRPEPRPSTRKRRPSPQNT